MERVVGGDLVGLAARADASDADGDDLAVADDGGGHAGDVVLLDDGGEERGDVLWRWGLGVDRDGDEAEKGDSDGENGFHKRGSMLGCHTHRPVVRTSHRQKNLGKSWVWGGSHSNKIWRLRPEKLTRKRQSQISNPKPNEQNKHDHSRSRPR